MWAYVDTSPDIPNLDYSKVCTSQFNNSPVQAYVDTSPDIPNLDYSKVCTSQFNNSPVQAYAHTSPDIPKLDYSKVCTSQFNNSPRCGHMWTQAQTFLNWIIPRYLPVSLLTALVWAYVDTSPDIPNLDYSKVCTSQFNNSRGAGICRYKPRHS